VAHSFKDAFRDLSGEEKASSIENCTNKPVCRFLASPHAVSFKARLSDEARAVLKGELLPIEISRPSKPFMKKAFPQAAATHPFASEHRASPPVR
jgi:hypothetical protein